MVCQDNTYTGLYSLPSDINNMLNTFVNVRPPFSSKWDINISESIYNMTNMTQVVTHNCSRASNLECITSTCGSTCTNSYVTTSNHHKNLYAFENQMYLLNVKGSFNVLLSATSVYACRNFNGNHQAGILGLGHTGYAAVVQNKTRGMLGNVRVIQHELSHGFGCLDNACSPGQYCIMNGGFDDNPIYTLNNIWCTNCQSRFNKYTY